MARKTYMPDSEIRKFETMDEAAVGAAIMPLGVSKIAALFVSLIRSYRISAMVANAVWRWIDLTEKGAFTDAKEAYIEVQKTLNLYSPGRFPPYRSDLEFGCRLLEETYDHLSHWSDRDAAVVLEQLFERITHMRAHLATALDEG